MAGTVGVEVDSDATEIEVDVLEGADEDDEPSDGTEVEKTGEGELTDLPPTIQTLIKNQRRELKEANRKIKELSEAKDGTEADANEVAEKWKAKYVNAAAAEALATAGAKNPAKLIKLLDLAEVDADEDFDIADQIDDLKDEFPELFSARSLTKAPDTTAKKAAPKKQTATEKQMAALGLKK